MEGLPDPTNSVWATMSSTELHFTGEFPRSLTPWDWYFLSGSLPSGTALSKRDRWHFAGRLCHFKPNNHWRFAFCGNHLENVYGGMDIEASEKSVVEISYNESSGSGAGMWVVPWQPVFVPASPSQYFDS